MNRFALLAASALGFTGVALGAFGAHSLRSQLSAEQMAIFQTGTQYQLYHALALLALAALSDRVRSPWPARLFLVGVSIFSGSLYILALTGVKAWGAVTPIGGICLLTAWGILFCGALKLPK